MMKVLIAGAEGSLGEYLTNFLGTIHEIIPLGKARLDVSIKSKCIESISNIKPDIVINCAAIANIDLCERDEAYAYQVNTLGALNLALACSENNIPILQLSCSYVYDGSKTSAYYETDPCSPINVYGKTKLAGESLIRTICQKYFILRTSWVFGGRNCFVKSILEHKEIPIYTSYSEISCPTYIKDLSAAIERIMCSNIYGVYNCVNSGAVKKSLWVKTIVNYRNIKKDVVEIPDTYVSNRALRPKSTILNTALIKNCFDIEMRSWEEALKEYVNIYK
jgi:dTDP-4-dehydrorhamnose reductase